MKLPFECFSHNFCANYEIWKIRVVVLLLVINIMSVLFSMLFQTMIVSVLYLLYMYPHVLQRRDVSSQYDGWMPSEMRFTCSQFLPTKVRDICKFATIQCENALKWTKEPMKTTCCLTPCPQNYNIARTPIPAPPHRRRIPQQVCGGYKALGKPPRGCFSAFKTATRRDFEHFVRSVTIWLASISQLTAMKRGDSYSNDIQFDENVDINNKLMLNLVITIHNPFHIIKCAFPNQTKLKTVHCEVTKRTLSATWLAPTLLTLAAMKWLQKSKSWLLWFEQLWFEDKPNYVVFNLYLTWKS